MTLQGNRVRRLMRAALGVGLLCGLSGCRHRTQIAAPLPVIKSPVDLLDIPEAENLPLIEAPPEKLPPEPTAAAAAKPKRERRKKVVAPVVTPAPVAPPVLTANVDPSPEVTAIGALTAGGEASPQSLEMLKGRRRWLRRLNCCWMIWRSRFSALGHSFGLWAWGEKQDSPRNSSRWDCELLRSK